MTWIQRDGYFLSTAPQGSKPWSDARIGRITASVAAKVMGLSPYHRNNDERNTLLARQILGLEPSKAPTAAMRHGTNNEAKVRDWFVDTYCPRRKLKRTVKEIGLAVWEDDQRFGASLDAEVFFDDGWGEFSEGLGESTEALEIKSKQRMPLSLVQRASAGANLSIASIPPDDYVQMQIAGFITIKTHVWYVVSVGTQYYVERVLVDNLKVINEYLPAMAAFYDKYMQPLIDKDPLLKPREIIVEEDSSSSSEEDEKEIVPKLERVKTEARRRLVPPKHTNPRHRASLDHL